MGVAHLGDEHIMHRGGEVRITVHDTVEAMGGMYQMLVGDGKRTQFMATVLGLLPTVGPFTREVHHLEIAGTVQGVA